MYQLWCTFKKVPTWCTSFMMYPTHRSIDNHYNYYFLIRREVCTTVVNVQTETSVESWRLSKKILYNAKSKQMRSIVEWRDCCSLHTDTSKVFCDLLQDTHTEGKSNLFVLYKYLFYWRIWGHEKIKTSLLTWSDVDLAPSVCVL